MRLLVLISMMLITASLYAQRLPLDDSLSPRLTANLDLSLSVDALRDMITSIISGDENAQPVRSGLIPQVDIRLNTRDYKGKLARIYLTLPVSIKGIVSPDSILLSWRTSGKFSNGQIRPGQTTLLFQGVIEREVSGDIFDFKLELNPDYTFPPSFRIEPGYEIELL